MAGKSKRGISQPCSDGTNNDTLANQHCDSMGVFPFSQQRVWCQSFSLLSVRVNAIWTLKRNFGAGSINASFFLKDFNLSKNQPINLCATVAPNAVVQEQDHRPQQPQTSPAALRKDHIEKSSRSASASVGGFWFC